MGVSFGGFLCVDPGSLRDQCAAQSLPAEWFGKPCSYECPAGPDSGTGWILLPRGFVDKVADNQLHPLWFTSQEADGFIRELELPAMVVVSAECVTPGLRGDPAAAYLVRLADRRWLLRQIPIDKAYNVLIPDRGGSTPTYYSATLNGGEPWTWQEMFADIWDILELNNGAVPVLPETAQTFGETQTLPQNFSFYGAYAIQALQAVLQALGCSLGYDPIEDVFYIFELGVEDIDADEALTEYDTLRIWDTDPIEPGLGNVPGTVTVAFRKDPIAPDQDGDSPYYTIQEEDPEGALPGTDEDATVWLFDSLLATFADPTAAPLNIDELQTTAEQRAAEFFGNLRLADLRRVYGRVLNDFRLLPGPQVDSIRWGDRGRGMVTEIVRRRQEPAPAPLEPERPLPLATVQVLDATPVQIYVKPDTTHEAYPLTVYGAVLLIWNNDTVGWDKIYEVWYVEDNGVQPGQGVNYDCRLLGQDICGKEIWHTEAHCCSGTGAATTTTTTTTAAPCTGTCQYTSSNGVTWSLTSNGCATTTTSTTTSTTTTTSGPTTTTTTCNPFVVATTTTSTTTTTTAAPCCDCVPPTFCPTYSGQCTEVMCGAQGCVTTTADPCTTTTTTSGGSTTANTTTTSCCTTPCPDCQCYGPGCSGGGGGGNCASNSLCVDCGLINCTGSSGPCGSNVTCDCECTVLPPCNVSGNCIWTCGADGNWTGISLCSGNRGCPPCDFCCDPPSIPCTVCATSISTKCYCCNCAGDGGGGGGGGGTNGTGQQICCNGGGGGNTTTTTQPPCSGQCIWQCNLEYYPGIGFSVWQQVANSCSGTDCGCCPPLFACTQSCETLQTPCLSPPLCTTTTSTTTTTTTTTTTRTTTTTTSTTTTTCAPACTVSCPTGYVMGSWGCGVSYFSCMDGTCENLGGGCSGGSNCPFETTFPICSGSLGAGCPTQQFATPCCRSTSETTTTTAGNTTPTAAP